VPACLRDLVRLRPELLVLDRLVLLVLERPPPLAATVRAGALPPELELGRVPLGWRAVLLLLLPAARDRRCPAAPFVEPLEARG
jgi:hypothetical protein